MALKGFKALAAEITAPPTVPTAVSAIPYTRTKLQAFAANDPVQDELDQDINPDINSRDVLRIRTNRIVDKYELTQEKEEEREREQNGGLTDFELHQVVADAINRIYYQDPTPEPAPYVRLAPPGYSTGNTHVGSDGKKYTAVLDEDGKVAYFDTGASCTMNKGGLSATTPPKVNDDLIDSDQKFNITYKFDKDGNKVERTPDEANFALAMTRIDNQYTKLPYQLDMIDRINADVSGATTFKSAAPSGIKADTKPSEPFAAAVTAADAPAAETKSIMFKTPRTPAPWEKIEKPAVATIAPALEPSF